MTFLTGNLQTILEQPAAGFHVVAELTHTDYKSGLITVKSSVATVADENGHFELELAPNQGQSHSSQYRVRVYSNDASPQLVWSTTITVPDVATVDITTIISEAPYPPVDESQQALEAVQAAAAQALLDIGDAETDAVTAITDARDAGVTAIEDARDQGVGAIEQARDAAINAINGLVQQAEDARDASQDARDLSQAWATGTEPGGGGTKSSREHAEDSAQSASDAEGFKDDAETAANRIPDPTGQPDGKVPSSKDGVFELVERFGPEDLRDSAPFAVSPLAQRTKSAYAWDGFSTAGAVTETDNGLPWVNLVGDGFTVGGDGFDSPLAYRNSDGNITAVALPPPASFNPNNSGWKITGEVVVRTGTSDWAGFVLAKDADNYLVGRFFRRSTLQIISVVDGVPAQLLNQGVTFSGASTSQYAISALELQFTVFEGAAFIAFPEIGKFFEVNYASDSPWAGIGEAAYAGFTHSGASLTGIHNISIKNFRVSDA